MWFHGRPRMKARDASANAVTEMAKITISGERIRRSSIIVTFSAEMARAPPSIESRSAGLPAIGEFATTATAAFTSRNTPIHVNHGRVFMRRFGASAGLSWDSSATSNRIAMTRRDAGPYRRNSHMLSCANPVNAPCIAYTSAKPIKPSVIQRSRGSPDAR